MKRIMGIDYGDARTGVAISDLLCSIVGTTYVVPSRVREKAVADIVRLARDNDVGTIVVGLPKNMDGTEGPRAEKSRAVAHLLTEATGLERSCSGTSGAAPSRRTASCTPTAARRTSTARRSMPSRRA